MTQNERRRLYKPERQVNKLNMLSTATDNLQIKREATRVFHFYQPLELNSLDWHFKEVFKQLFNLKTSSYLNENNWQTFFTGDTC